MEHLLIIIVYSIAIGVYLLAFATSIYYFGVSRSQFTKNSIFFSFFAMIYAIFSLEAGFESSTPLKNLVDITILSAAGAFSLYFYIKNIESLLRIKNNVIKFFRYSNLLIGIWALVGLITYLFFDMAVYVEFSKIVHLNPYARTGLGGVNFSFIGQIVLIVEILLVITFFTYILVKYRKKLKKEPLLFIGISLSTVLISHDNILGLLSAHFIAPLMTLGYIPETFRFVLHIIATDAKKKKEYSRQLEASLKESAKSRISGQYIHDTSRLLNKLNFIESSSLKKEVQDLLKYKYRFLESEVGKNFINIKELIMFTNDLFTIELAQKKINFKLNQFDETFVRFNQSDFFIIFSTLIQNSIDHSRCNQIVVTVEVGAIEVQIYFYEKGYNTSKESVVESGNLGYGLVNAQNAAAANNSSLEKMEGYNYRLRILNS